MDDIGALALLDEPVRRRIYDWVAAQRRPVGREEAATALGIGRALAAFHLERLVKGGLLEASHRRLNARRGPGAGRPARVYERAARDFAVAVPERRYDVAADVLASALERGSRHVAAGAARDAGRQLGASLGASTTRRGSPRTRLRRILADGGYEPIDSAEDGAILLGNCPFDALVAAHRPIVCSMNLAMAEGIMDGLGEAAFVPILDARPGYCCVSFHPRDADT